MSQDNPRAVVGSNVPDYAKEEAARLEREFGDLKNEAKALEAEADKLPENVDSPEVANLYTAMINKNSDLDKRIEALRVGEGMQYLRKKDTVDSFFFGIREFLFKRKKTDKDGLGDRLNARLHAYNVRRLEEERRERERKEAEARAAEEAARKEREAREQAQRDAEAKAARARSEEGRRKAEEAARVQREAAARAAADEEVRRAERQEAEAAAKAKPADMVRERHSEAMNTMRMVWHVEITDQMQLDLAVLKPFIPLDALEKAAKNWAKVTGYKTPMAGLLIEQRPDTVVRR